MSSFKLCFLLVALLLASATLSLGSLDRDPRDEALKRCKQQCKLERQPDSRRICIQQCQEQARQGGGGPVELTEDPESEVEYIECRQVCTKESSDEDWKCERKCEKQPNEREDEEEEEQKQGRNNPYVFEDRHFITGLQTQHGRLRTLPKFSQRSSLLKGIKNYRVSILEADPHTFILPSHLDADSIVFVAKGKGTLSSIQEERRENKRESFNINEGDIFRVKAGTTSYLINRDNRDKLVLVELIQPVNIPGTFVPFFGAGGENPESFYRVFSNEILEAAFNTKSDKLERVLGQQKQGSIIKASEAQIKALSQGDQGGIFPFPFPSESKDTHNIYEQRPERRNQYGQLYEVNQHQFRPLRDLDLAITLANISQGAMTAPHYNSRATKISIVVQGEGYFEMACPHLSDSQSHRRGRGEESQESHRRGRGEESQESHRGGRGEESQESQKGQSQGSIGYRKIRANLKVGTVVVVPAGHPFVAVASNNQNLQILCFEVNAENNEKYTLAGKRNVVRQFEKEAKQLAFGVAAREVDEVFNSQQEDFFFKGPRQQGPGRAEA